MTTEMAAWPCSKCGTYVVVPPDTFAWLCDDCKPDEEPRAVKISWGVDLATGPSHTVYIPKDIT